MGYRGQLPSHGKVTEDPSTPRMLFTHMNQPGLLQVLPSVLSVEPSGHSHWKEPPVFLHLCWHPPLLTAHSFMSVGME